MPCPAGTNLDSALRSSSSHLIMILICHTGSVLLGNKTGMSGCLREKWMDNG